MLEVIDSSLEKDIPEDADSALPTTQLAPASPSTSTDAAAQAFSPLAAQSLGPETASGPRRSTRENRGVPPPRMANMLMAATLETSDSDPKTYKQALAMVGQEASFLRQLQIQMEGEAGIPTLG